MLVKNAEALHGCAIPKKNGTSSIVKLIYTNYLSYTPVIIIGKGGMKYYYLSMLVLFLTVSVITLSLTTKLQIHAQPNGGLIDYQPPIIDDLNPSPPMVPPPSSTPIIRSLEIPHCARDFWVSIH